jgi:hypothetical protein
MTLLISNCVTGDISSTFGAMTISPLLDFQSLVWKREGDFHTEEGEASGSAPITPLNILLPPPMRVVSGD